MPHSFSPNSANSSAQVQSSKLTTTHAIQAQVLSRSQAKVPAIKFSHTFSKSRAKSSAQASRQRSFIAKFSPKLQRQVQAKDSASSAKFQHKLPLHKFASHAQLRQPTVPRPSSSTPQASKIQPSQVSQPHTRRKLQPNLREPVQPTVSPRLQPAQRSSQAPKTDQPSSAQASRQTFRPTVQAIVQPNDLKSPHIFEPSQPSSANVAADSSSPSHGQQFSQRLAN
ncbi:hypothetical protein C0Q70_09242 [Pomacea canaliculata]|uniref:Uncharacterized protein n=1 Tax=Pomacea canaliculata TaxID=400727 RepID=A0A2T7P9A2_POMCA|nr:hypothetical protein C0Q70_09242 [Pomacea canaliculata]